MEKIFRAELPNHERKTSLLCNLVTLQVIRSRYAIQLVDSRFESLRENCSLLVRIICRAECVEYLLVSQLHKQVNDLPSMFDFHAFQ